MGDSAVLKKSIVWLDGSVNSTTENLNAQQMFQTPTNHLKTFTDEKECENYIRSVSKDHQIILIVSGRLGSSMVPRIHQLLQVSVIFVYCINRKNEHWVKTYKKIKGVLEDINTLVIEVLAAQEKQTNLNRFQESIPITIFHTSSIGEQSTTELNGRFVHFQILIDCLSRMRSNQTDRDQFFNYCKSEYAHDRFESNTIDEFEQDYSGDRAVRWYTRDCFVYRLLNRALRVQNIDALYLFSFMIRDLQRELQRHQYAAPINVYRGQLMSKKEVQQLERSIGQLISMNSFLSTTMDREVAIIFSGATDPPVSDLQSVLFEIQADPHVVGSKPFADITKLSYMHDEEEVLMMIGSIFRLAHMRSEGRLCIFQLELCSENGHDVKPIFDQMKMDYHGDGHTNAAVFGIVLANMGKFDEAEKYLRRSFDEVRPNNRPDETYNYNQSVYNVNLGNVALRKGDYNQALDLFRRALDLRLQIKKPNDSFIADIHNLIGGVYLRKNEYERALDSFNQALTIYKQTYGENHEKLAEVYSNIGANYFKQQKYSEALDHQKKALDIQRKHLQPYHHLLITSYNNIATSYLYLHQPDLALEHFNQALKICEKSLPPLHPNLAPIYNNIGGLYVEKRDLHQAISYFEKAADILNKTVGSSHPDAVSIQQNIRYIRSYLK